MMSWKEWRGVSVIAGSGSLSLRTLHSLAPGTEVVTKSMVAFALVGRQIGAWWYLPLRLWGYGADYIR